MKSCVMRSCTWKSILCGELFLTSLETLLMNIITTNQPRTLSSPARCIVAAIAAAGMMQMGETIIRTTTGGIMEPDIRTTTYTIPTMSLDMTPTAIPITLITIHTTTHTAPIIVPIIPTITGTPWWTGGSSGYSGGGSGYSTEVDYITNALGLSGQQSNWLSQNFLRADEIYTLLNSNYDALTFEDKKMLAKVHLERMMDDADYLEMVESYSANVSIHPWMIELFKELAIEIGFKLVQKYLPGYSDWDSIKDAIENASHGDWIGTLSEVINIVKRKVPWLAAVDAVFDAFDFGYISNKTWKAFDKLKDLPTNAFNGILKTIKDKCGGLLGKIMHDDNLGRNSIQAFVQYPTNDAHNFFNTLAANLGKTINPTSNGGGWFDLDGIRFNYYIESTSIPHLPTIQIIFPNGIQYKLRLIN